MSLRIFIIALVLIVIGVTGCKCQKQKLEEEARAEATKFWESQVFSKCGGEYGNYFGRQGSKIYEFRSPIVIALSADEEKRQGVDWMGTTTVLSTGVRFTNSRYPSTNFVASDYLMQRGHDFETLRAAWVHELGNSLAAMTGQPRQAKLPGMLAWDNDSGNALEECVYGGKVLNSTTVTTDPGRR